MEAPPVSRTIRFYFDYISPNAHLAWTQLPAMAERHGYGIETVPVLFAGLLEAHGGLGPAEMPAKALWMSKNNLRKSILLGVPVNQPAFHPFNPLLALRASSIPADPAGRAALVGALMDAVWVRSLHVSDPAVVERVCGEIGLDGAALVAEAQQSEAKTRLRDQTAAAIARGVFGVPSMVVGDEVFWGFDDFPHLELLLAGKDPLAGVEWGQWSPPKASAMREQHRRRTEQ
jgi:2-hydroxychromene-2-carboxylate isomerase